MVWRRRVTVAAATVALAIAATGPASAQSLAAVARPPVPGQAVSPESFAREYVAAFRKGDWNAVGRFFHPEALAEFRAAATKLIDAKDDRARDMRLVLSGSESGAGLRELSAEELFTRFTSQIFSRLPKDVRDQLFKPMGEVLGSVPDGADVVHVVYRTRVPVFGTFVNTTDVMTVKRTPAGWGVMLNREFATMMLTMGQLQ